MKTCAALQQVVRNAPIRTETQNFTGGSQNQEFDSLRYGEISVPAEVEQRGVLQNISDQLKSRSLSLQVQREVVGALLSLTLISRNCLLLFKSGTVEELLRLLVETKDE